MLVRIASLEVSDAEAAVESVNGFTSYTIEKDVQGRWLPDQWIRAAIVIAVQAEHDVDPGASPTGLGADHAVSSVGFVADRYQHDPTPGDFISQTRYCVSSYARDNVSTTVSQHVHVEDVDMYLANPTGAGWTPTGGASYGPFYADTGITVLNPLGVYAPSPWIAALQGRLRFQKSAGSGRGYKVTWVLFYGADSYINAPGDEAGDIQATVGVASVNSGSAVFVDTINSWSITGEVFSPTHIFAVSAGSSTWHASHQATLGATDGLVYDSSFTNWESDLQLSFGISQRDLFGGSSTRNVTWSDQTGLSTTKTGLVLHEAYSLFKLISGAGVVTGPANITPKDGGFLVEPGFPGATYDFTYLALNLGTHTASELWTYTTESGTGNTELLIPTPGGGTDAGQRLNPDGLFTLQTQTLYSQIGAGQSGSSSATMGFGAASSGGGIRVYERLKYYRFGGPTNPAYDQRSWLFGDLLADFIDYTWSDGDYVEILSCDGGVSTTSLDHVVLGRFDVLGTDPDPAYTATTEPLFSGIRLDGEVYTHIYPLSSTGHTIAGFFRVILHARCFELSKGQRSIGWQSKDNSSTSDTQSSVWDELGYLLKKHGTATYPTNTVTRFEWIDHDAASAATTQDAVFNYHSSTVNARQWAMLAFEFQRQRVGVLGASTEASAPGIDLIHILNAIKLYVGRAAIFDASAGVPKAFNHKQFLKVSAVSINLSSSSREFRFIMHLGAAYATVAASSPVINLTFYATSAASQATVLDPELRQIIDYTATVAVSVVTSAAPVINQTFYASVTLTPMVSVAPGEIRQTFYATSSSSSVAAVHPEDIGFIMHPSGAVATVTAIPPAEFRYILDLLGAVMVPTSALTPELRQLLDFISPPAVAVVVAGTPDISVVYFADVVAVSVPAPAPELRQILRVGLAVTSIPAVSPWPDGVPDYGPAYPTVIAVPVPAVQHSEIRFKMHPAAVVVNTAGLSPATELTRQFIRPVAVVVPAVVPAPARVEVRAILATAASSQVSAVQPTSASTTKETRHPAAATWSAEVPAPAVAVLAVQRATPGAVNTSVTALDPVVSRLQITRVVSVATTVVEPVMPMRQLDLALWPTTATARMLPSAPTATLTRRYGHPQPPEHSGGQPPHGRPICRNLPLGPASGVPRSRHMPRPGAGLAATSPDRRCASSPGGPPLCRIYRARRRRRGYGIRCAYRLRCRPVP